ncbi:MAG TPA: lysylphosphatidylglycerol synthase domain-containing protein [Pseudonocardiaceae bacterium]
MTVPAGSDVVAPPDSAVDSSPAPATSSAAKRRLLTAARILVTLTLLAAVGYALVSQWEDVRSTVTSIPPQSLVMALGAALLGITCNVMAGRDVLRGLGQPVRTVEAGRFFLVGQLGKYLPGSVWAFVLQMELMKRAGIPRAVGFAGALITVGIATATSLVVGLLGLPALLSVGGIVPWLVLALVPLAIVCALPPVLSRLLTLVFRVLRRGSLSRQLGWSDTGRVTLWSLAAWFFFGTQLALLAGGFTGPGLDGWIRCIGAFSIAMTAGLIAVVAPSGIGVREGVLVAALSVYVSPGIALGLALTSRLILTVADVLAASVAAASGVRALRRTSA